MIADSPQSVYKSAFGAAAKETLARLFEQLMDNLPGTIAGNDIEALHDMRVASRRLRASLKVFKACFPAGCRKEVETDISGVTKALGQVRDQDVFIEHLKTYTRGEDKLNLRWLIDQERKSRDVAREAMLEALRQLDFLELDSRLETLFDSAKKTLADSKKLKCNQFGRQAYKMILPRLFDICSYDSVITDENDVAGLHAMRIAAKKLRYTLETFCPCFGEPMEEAIAHLKTMQDHLGMVHDCDVWMTKLNEYSELELTENRRSALESLMERMSQLRHQTYLKALEYWSSLREAYYAENLLDLVKS